MGYYFYIDIQLILKRLFVFQVNIILEDTFKMSWHGNTNSPYYSY